MYVDKPMRGHGLMQAIARVNRVFKDKPGGLVVDYLGLAQDLKQGARHLFTESGGTRSDGPGPRSEAVVVMIEKYEVCLRPVPRFRLDEVDDGHAAGTPDPVAGRPGTHTGPGGREGTLPERRKGALSQAFALAVPHPETTRIRDDVGFFQAVRAQLMKSAPGEARSEEELDLAVRQIISRAVASEGVMDIFAAAGLDKPDISVLSDEFLAEVRGHAASEPGSGVITEASQGRGVREAAEKRCSGPLLR